MTLRPIPEGQYPFSYQNISKPNFCSESKRITLPCVAFVISYCTCNSYANKLVDWIKGIILWTGSLHSVGLYLFCICGILFKKSSSPFPYTFMYRLYFFFSLLTNDLLQTCAKLWETGPSGPTLLQPGEQVSAPHKFVKKCLSWFNRSCGICCTLLASVSTF